MQFIYPLNVESSRKKEVSNAQTPEEKEESQVSFGDNEEKEQNAASAAPFFDFTKFSQKSAEECGATEALIKANSGHLSKLGMDKFLYQIKLTDNRHATRNFRKRPHFVTF